MFTLVSSVVCRSASVSASQIAEKAHELGVKVSFPEGIDLESDFGLVPCVFNGQPAGFELTSDGDEAEGLRTLHFEARVSYASFAACAYVAACVSLIADGVLRDEDGQAFSGPSLMSWLQSVEPPESEQAPDELRIEVSDVGPRGNGFLQLELGRVPPGTHLARRLVESIEIERVPPRLRAPNSRFIIVVRDASEIVAVEQAPTRGKTGA